MPLFPLPVIIAIAVWLAVFWSIAPVEVTWGGLHFKLYFQLAAIGMMALGTVAFLLWSRRMEMEENAFRPVSKEPLSTWK